MKVREAMDKDSRRILGTAEVSRMLGLNPVTLWRMCREGRFPLPIKLTARRNGWPLGQVEEWLAQRPHANYGTAKAA
jgi:prophage regulatory protein